MALGPQFRDRPHLSFQPLIIFCVVFLLQVVFAQLDRRVSPVFGTVRDWLPMLLTLVAFQEMEYFLPSRFEHHYEAAWIRQDYRLLHDWHLREVIESFGRLGPFYLELCYLLVYGLTAYCIAILYLNESRGSIDLFFTIYLAGTLGAYALFPFFPSEPPRLLYPTVEIPTVTTWARTLNLFVLRKGTIHVGVFPSAHVSSAFAAGWAMLFLLRRRRWIGWTLLLYAVSVSLATIYGRYHYTADALAGFGLSAVTSAVCIALLRPSHGSSNG